MISIILRNQHFFNDVDALNYLIHWNIIKQNIPCQNCDRVNILNFDEIHKKLSFKCFFCGRSTSIRYRTPLYNLKIPFCSFLFIINSFIDDITVDEIANSFRLFNNAIHPQTIRTYMIYLRKIIGRFMSHYISTLQLSGTLEVDECMITAKRKGRIGRIPTFNLWVLGILQRENHLPIIYIVPNRQIATLHPLIENHIISSMETMIISPGFFFR